MMMEGRGIDGGTEEMEVPKTPSLPGLGNWSGISRTHHRLQRSAGLTPRVSTHL
jgi:hypothetical protein